MKCRKDVKNAKADGFVKRWAFFEICYDRKRSQCVAAASRGFREDDIYAVNKSFERDTCVGHTISRTA